MIKAISELSALINVTVWMMRHVTRTQVNVLDRNVQPDIMCRRDKDIVQVTYNSLYCDKSQMLLWVYYNKKSWSIQTSACFWEPLLYCNKSVTITQTCVWWSKSSSVIIIEGTLKISILYVYQTYEMILFSCNKHVLVIHCGSTSNHVLYNVKVTKVWFTVHR